MKKAKIKALFPEEVETITISKNDYDRLYGNLTLENIELKQEIERLENIIKEVREEIRILETNCDISSYQAQKLIQILDKDSDKE